MTRWIKYSLVGLALLLALVLLLGAAGIAYLNTSGGQQRLAKAINRRIPGTLSWDDLALRPLAGALALDNLTVADPEGRAVLFAARAALDWQWLPLVQGRIVIRHLNIDQLRLDIQGQGPGDLNIVRSFAAANPDPTPKKEPAGPLPVDLQVDELSVTDATLNLAPAAAWPGVHLEGLEIQAAGQLAARRATLDLAFAKGAVIRNGRRVGLNNFNLSLPISPEAVAPLSLRLGFPGGQLDIQGALQDPFGTLQLDLTATLAAEAAQAGRIVAPELALSGRLDATLKVQGALHDPRLDLSASWPRGTIQEISWEGLVANLQFWHRKLTIDAFDLAAFGGTTHLTGQVDLGSGEGFAFGKAAYDLALELESIRSPSLPFGQKLPAGTLAAAFTFTGSGLTPDQMAADFQGDARFELDLTAGRRDSQTSDLDPDRDPDFETVALHLDSRLKGSEIGITQLRLTGMGSHIEGQGQLNWQDQHLDVQYQASLADLGRLARMTGIPPLAGRLEAAGSAAGAWNRPKIEMVLSGQGLEMDKARLGNLNADLRLDEQGHLTLAELRLKNQQSQLQGHGAWDLPVGPAQPWGDAPLALDMIIANLRPADFLPDSPASGSFRGNIALTGSLKAPRGVVDLQGEDLSALDYRVGDLEARIQLAGPRISVERFHLENRRSRVDLQGTLLLPWGEELDSDAETEPMALTLTAQPLFLEDFLPDLQGAVTLNANLAGTLKAPRGQAELKAQGLTLYGQSLARAQAQINFTADGVAAEDLRLTLVPGEEIQGQGRYSFDGGFAFELAGSDLHLRQIQAWRQRDLPDGRLMLQATGKGSLEDPRINANLRLDQMTVESRQVPELNADLGLAGKELTLQADLGFPLEATYDLAEGRLTARGRWSQSDLSPYFRLAGQSDLGGTLSGGVTLEGNLAQPTSMKADLNLSDVALTRRGETLLQTVNLRGTLTEGRWNVAPADLVLLNRSDLENRLMVAGQGTLDGALQATLKGAIPAALAEAWLKPEWSPQGELGVDIRLGGKLSEPQLTGSLELDALGLTIPEWGQTLRQLDGRIEFSPQTVRLSQVKGMLDEGRFDIQGNLALVDFRPASVDLSFGMAALPVDIPETLAVTATGDLKLAGTPQALLLSGRVELLESSYTRDIDLAPLPAGALDEAPLTEENDGATDSASQEPPDLQRKTWKEDLTFDVALKQRDPLLVENNLANLDIAFDLVLRGSLADPALSGRAEVLSGEVSYPLLSASGLPLASLLPTRTISFEVTRGVLDFVNPYAIEPELDIVGQTVVREWEIFLKLSGVPDALDFELTSQPAESQADILSLLLIGKTTGELAKGGGGVSLSPEKLAQDLFGSSLTGGLQRAAGLDILETQTGSEADGESTGREVTVGRHLSDRLTVKYSMGTEEGERLERAVADYRLYPNVTASGYRDSLGRFGGALRWRLEFR